MTCPPDVPQWVNALRDDPHPGAVIDLLNGGESIDLFYQTVHHRPIADGNLSRIPENVWLASEAVLNDVKQRQYQALAQEGFGFLIIGEHAEPLALPIMYSDRTVRIYRLLTKPSTTSSR